MASPVVDGCLTMRREVCLWEISDCDQSVGTQDSQEQGVEEDHAFNINVYCGSLTHFEVIIGFIFEMICIFCWAYWEYIVSVVGNVGIIQITER